MANKKGGVLALLAALTAGATALFLSKKENRDKVKKGLAKGEQAVGQAAKDLKKNPRAFAKKVKSKAKAAAKKTAKKVMAAEKQVEQKMMMVRKGVDKLTAKKMPKKMVSKRPASPVMKVVGKKKMGRKKKT